MLLLKSTKETIEDSRFIDAGGRSEKQMDQTGPWYWTNMFFSEFSKFWQNCENLERGTDFSLYMILYDSSLPFYMDPGPCTTWFLVLVKGKIEDKIGKREAKIGKRVANRIIHLGFFFGEPKTI